jgi:long-chain-fatty-acid--CoA ligase ACSBG
MNTLPKIPDDEYLSVSKEGLEFILANFDPQVPDRNFLWTTDYRVELPVRVKKSGPGSEVPYTLVEMWRRSLARFSNLAALSYEAAPSQWRTITYRQYFELALNFGKSLIALGISEYTAVNIIGFNSV